MNKPMIENADRGITINKTLAWGMIVVLAGAIGTAGKLGLDVGREVQAISTAIETLEARQVEDRADIRSNTSEVNALARAQGRIDQRLVTIEQASSRAEQSARRAEEGVQEILRYLRGGDRP